MAANVQFNSRQLSIPVPDDQAPAPSRERLEAAHRTKAPGHQIGVGQLPGSSLWLLFEAHRPGSEWEGGCGPAWAYTGRESERLPAGCIRPTRGSGKQVGFRVAGELMEYCGVAVLVMLLSC